MSTKNNTPVQSSLLVKRQQNQVSSPSPSEIIKESKEENDEDIDLAILLGTNKRVKMEEEKPAIEPPAPTNFQIEEINAEASE